jgi:hypothetical protein
LLTLGFVKDSIRASSLLYLSKESVLKLLVTKISIYGHSSHMSAIFWKCVFPALLKSSNSLTLKSGNFLAKLLAFSSSSFECRITASVIPSTKIKLHVYQSCLLLRIVRIFHGFSSQNTLYGFML